MAVGDAYVFPGFLTPVLPQLFFPKPLTTFLTCFCIGIPERKVASTGDRTRNHQVMSLSRSPLSHPSGGLKEVDPINLTFCMAKKRFNSTQIYNKECNIGIKWIRASIIRILCFLLKISIAFHWRNDTHNGRH